MWFLNKTRGRRWGGPFLGRESARTRGHSEKRDRGPFIKSAQKGKREFGKRGKVKKEPWGSLGSVKARRKIKPQSPFVRGEKKLDRKGRW